MTPRRHRFLIDFQKIFSDFCAERIPIPFVPFVSLDVQKKHQIIREHRKTRKTRLFYDALGISIDFWKIFSDLTSSSSSLHGKAQTSLALRLLRSSVLRGAHPNPFRSFRVFRCSKKHQIIREHRKTRKTRIFYDAPAVQAAVGVVVVGALHNAVLPHDAQRKKTPKLPNSLEQ